MILRIFVTTTLFNHNKYSFTTFNCNIWNTDNFLFGSNLMPGNEIFLRVICEKPGKIFLLGFQVLTFETLFKVSNDWFLKFWKKCTFLWDFTKFFITIIFQNTSGLLFPKCLTVGYRNFIIFIIFIIFIATLSLSLSISVIIDYSFNKLQINSTQVKCFLITNYKKHQLLEPNIVNTVNVSKIVALKLETWGMNND